MNIYNFDKNSEQEKKFIELHGNLSKLTSKMIRSLPQDDRFPALKKANPTDTSLLALYLWAIRQEDYETCKVAKALIEERGIPITRWPSP